MFEKNAEFARMLDAGILNVHRSQKNAQDTLLGMHVRKQKSVRGGLGADESHAIANSKVRTGIIEAARHCRVTWQD